MDKVVLRLPDDFLPEDEAVHVLALEDNPPRYDDVSDVKPLLVLRAQARADICSIRRFILTYISIPKTAKGRRMSKR